MYDKRAGLIAILIFTTVTIALVLLGASGPARILFGLPLALLLPGYSLQAVVDRACQLTFIEQLLLSIGLSLAMTCLSSFALNWSPWGINGVSLAILLGGMTIVFTLIALWRQTKARLPLRTLQFNLTHSRIQILLFTGGLILTVLSGVIAHTSESRLQQPAFTELWMLRTQDNINLRIGIHNQEQQAMRYRLTVKAGQWIIGQWEEISLLHDQRWEIIVSQLPEASARPFITAYLYRLDNPRQIYREVELRF